MTTRIIVIASILSALSISTASAGAPAPDNLWFTLLDSSDASITVNAQGPGETLEIIKPNSGPATISIGVNISSNTGFLAAWGISLLSTLGGSIANSSTLAGYDQFFGSPANGTSILNIGRGASNTAGPVGQILAFDLVIAGNVPITITGEYLNNIGIVKNNGLAWYGRVGANQVSYAPPYQYSTNGNSWGVLPVVMITPEPSTLGLFGLGIVLLVRRKR